MWSKTQALFLKTQVSFLVQKSKLLHYHNHPQAEFCWLTRLQLHEMSIQIAIIISSHFMSSHLI